MELGSKSKQMLLNGKEAVSTVKKPFKLVKLTLLKQVARNRNYSRLKVKGELKNQNKFLR